MTRPLLTAGFLPLLDSVLLVLAHELGLAEEEGFDLALTRETSWANIRDRAALGHFDIALMLAPMPIAANLGLTPLATRMIAPVVAGLGNNAITVSPEIWSAMAGAGAVENLDASTNGKALAKVVAQSPRKLRFGVVHQTSSHNYELRYWLAASGIVPDRDIEIVVLPPPLLPEALGSGGLDGYCVGEPWNSVGVSRHGAHIATTKSHIWQWSPDKVIGMRADWADRHPDLAAGVIRAIVRAGQWCQDRNNRREAARIMAGAAYLDQPEALVARSLTGEIETGSGIRTIPDFLIPSEGAANFPWKSHALWYYSQMVRWGEVSASAEHAAIAAATFRPDLFRAAVSQLDWPVPAEDLKREGDWSTPHSVSATGTATIELGPNRFFDNEIFTPETVQSYIDRQLPKK